MNLQRGQEIQGIHGVRSLFLGAILLHGRLNGLSVYANGGHNPPYLLHKDGTIEPNKSTGDIALAGVD